MSFNPMDVVRNFINKSIDTASESLDIVSSDVSKAITPIVQNVKENIKTPEPTKTPEPAKTPEPTKTPEPDETNELVPYEKKFQSSYIGCYSDDPVNPSMDKFLGTVSNISECINIGKENNFEYVGIRGGNQCFASNTIPTTKSVNRTKYCNIGCDDIGTGNCGGFFYNQVYKTTIFNDLPKLNNTTDNLEPSKKQELTSNAINILENFISSDTDMKKITMGLNTESFNYWKPLNTYVIFIWLVVLIFLIYLLFEYLYKKNKEKII